MEEKLKEAELEEDHLEEGEAIKQEGEKEYLFLTRDACL